MAQREKFLPMMDQSAQPPAPNAGADWGLFPGGLSVLSRFAGALDVPNSVVSAERVARSVPSPWGRLLLFEQALFNSSHPAHRQVTSEWRGLMGAIGLARYLRIEVKARALRLEGAAGPIGDVRAMAPRGDSANAWDRLGLIDIGGRLVGGTSPRTLVFTGQRGGAGSIPFQANGRLIDPVSYYQGAQDRISLSIVVDWLELLRESLTNEIEHVSRYLGTMPGASGAAPVARYAQLMSVLAEWSTDAERASQLIGRYPGQLVSRMEASQISLAFPDGHGARRALGAVAQAVVVEGIAAEHGLEADGLGTAIDPGKHGVFMRDGHPYTGSIQLPNGMGRGVVDGRFSVRPSMADIGATVPELTEFFSDRLIELTEVNNARVVSLELSGRRFLLPVKEKILNFVGPELLGKWMRMRSGGAGNIIVSIEVPLRNNISLVFAHEYASADVYQRADVVSPSIAVWPDFVSPSWKHYFYFERKPGQRGLELTPWHGAGAAVEQAQDHQQGARWVRLESPAKAWIGRFMQSTGLLVARPMPTVPPDSQSWDVSIDFGSTHTRAFRSSAGMDGLPQVHEVSFQSRAASLLGADANLPYYFFASPAEHSSAQIEPPSLIWRPTVTAGEQDAGRRTWLPADGVMYRQLPDQSSDMTGVRGNLKWHGNNADEKSAFDAYVSQLYLCILAEAAAAGAKVRSLITAYPSVLPNWLRTRHRNQWQSLAALFNVVVRPPRSESEALAAYMAHGGAPIAANLIAVDVGGSTSDVTVWINSALRATDSIRFAGDLLGRAVNNEQRVRESISDGLRRVPFGQSVLWKDDDPTKNGLLLNAILRTVAQHQSYRANRAALAENIYAGPGSNGERTLAYLTYLFAALSYMLGMMVKRVGAPYGRYDVQFAGRGAEYLSWLDAVSSDASRVIPRDFFIAGFGALPADGTTVGVTPVGGEAKQEVGRGLLLDMPLEGAAADSRETFLGEAGYTAGGRPLEWSDTLTAEVLKKIDAPERPRSMESYIHFAQFLATFEQSPAGRSATEALGLKAVMSDACAAYVHTRLFGPQSTWRKLRAGEADATVLEPKFIAIAKAVLEHATGNPQLFA